MNLNTAAHPIGAPFARTSRLLTNADYRQVMTNARKLHSKGVSFYFRKNSSDVTRLGVIVQKKKIRTAVQRNRLKRLLREHFRHIQAEIVGYDIVAFINQTIPKEEMVKFTQTLSASWARLIRHCQT